MDLIGQADFLVRVQHRHNDGTWGELAPQRSHHDAADHDPESDWAKGAALSLHDVRRGGPDQRDRADREPLGGR